MNRRKVKNEDVKQQTPMEDLIDLDFSGFGPETVRMDDAWSVATDKTRRINLPPRISRLWGWAFRRCSPKALQ